MTLARMVHRKGERHQLQIDSLHRLARAAGIALEDVYDADELAEARAHEGERVSIRIRAYDLVADLPKSDSILWALLAERHEKEFRALVHRAKREAFTELERWIGYGLAGEDGAPPHHDRPRDHSSDGRRARLRWPPRLRGDGQPVVGRR